jgi:hypothetical protein
MMPPYMANCALSASLGNSIPPNLYARTRPPFNRCTAFHTIARLRCGKPQDIRTYGQIPERGLCWERMAEGKKDPVAQAMVAKRWKKTTPEERSDVARQLNTARWGKKKKKKA